MEIAASTTGRAQPARTTASAHEVLRRVAERTRRYDFTVWFWGDAIAIDGLLDAADLLDVASPRDHCLGFYRRWALRPLGWADHLTPGLALLRLHDHTGDPLLLEAAERLATWLLDEAPRSAGGAALYRPDLPAYRHTVWVDTIYHEPPFLARLAQITGEGRYADAAVDIWESHARVLAGDGSPILAHAADTGAGERRGLGWGRGNGWALFGMIDTLELLPEDHPRRRWAEGAFADLARAVLARQDASGFWRTLLDDREAYLESSTASFFGAALTKAVRLGLLGEEAVEPAARAWAATLSRIDDGGAFFGVSAVTHAGVSPTDDVTMYRTLPTEVNVWGQGSALRLAAERLRAGLG